MPMFYKNSVVRASVLRLISTRRLHLELFTPLQLVGGGRLGEFHYPVTTRLSDPSTFPLLLLSNPFHLVLLTSRGRKREGAGRMREGMRTKLQKVELLA